jgi:hypothetical protein
MKFGRNPPTFRRNVFLPTSGPKRKTCKKPALSTQEGKLAVQP